MFEQFSGVIITVSRGTDKLELVSCFFQGLGVGRDIEVYLQK